MTNKTPPFSEEAERALLGCIMLEGTVLQLCREFKVTPLTFYILKHRVIYQICLDLFYAGKAIDVTTVHQCMKDRNEEWVTGDENTLLEMIDDTPTATHAKSYIDILKEKEMGRSCIVIARTMDDATYSGSDPKQVITNAVSMALNTLTSNDSRKTPQEMHDAFIRNRESARANGHTGFKTYLDSTIGTLIPSWNPPDNVVIGAKSSIGKTMFMLEEISAQARAGVPCAIFSTDMTEEQLRLRIAANMSDVNSFHFQKQFWTDKEAELIDEAYQQQYDWPLYFNDNADAVCDDVIAWGTAMVAKHGVRIFALDFLQQLRRAKDEYRDDYRMVISEWSSRLKGFGKRFNVLTMILSQLGRYGEKASTKTPPIPNKEALKESGDIENNADIIILLAQEPDQPKTLFTWENPVWNMVANIDKHRNGPTGMVDLCVYPSRGRWMSRVIGADLREEIEERRRARQ